MQGMVGRPLRCGLKLNAVVDLGIFVEYAPRQQFLRNSCDVRMTLPRREKLTSMGYPVSSISNGVDRIEVKPAKLTVTGIHEPLQFVS